jgi:ATP-binding cassette subfamily B protein
LYLTTLYDLLDRRPLIDAPEEPKPVGRPVHAWNRVSERDLPLPGPDRASLGERVVQHRARRDDRASGAQRRREVDDRQAAGPALRPTEGQILVDGRDIREYDPIEYRQQIGMMFQDYVMYQLSAGRTSGWETSSTSTTLRRSHTR